MPYLMMLDARTHRPYPRAHIRMNVDFAVFPTTLPRMAIDDYRVRRPAKCRTGTPGCECGADGYPRTKADRASHYQSPCRPGKDNHGVVIRDIDYARIGRQDLDIAAIRHHLNIVVGLQIAEVPRLLPHSL